MCTPSPERWLARGKVVGVWEGGGGGVVALLVLGSAAQLCASVVLALMLADGGWRRRGSLNEAVQGEGEVCWQLLRLEEGGMAWVGKPAAAGRCERRCG